MAINPMLQQLNRNALSQMQGNVSQIRNMINMVKGAGNPQMMMQSLLRQNPQVQQAMNYVQQNGGDAKQAFYSLAQQKGIDPNEVLKMLK